MAKRKSGFSTKKLCALMGKKVRATAACTYPYQVEGWLVGSTYRRTGKTRYEGYEVGHVFESTGPSRHVFLLRQWPTRKAIDIDPKSIELLPDDYEIPNPDWRQSARDEMAAEANQKDRDKKGRFV